MGPSAPKRSREGAPHREDAQKTLEAGADEPPNKKSKIDADLSAAAVGENAAVEPPNKKSKIDVELSAAAVGENAGAECDTAYLFKGWAQPARRQNVEFKTGRKLNVRIHSDYARIQSGAR